MWLSARQAGAKFALLSWLGTASGTPDCKSFFLFSFHHHIMLRGSRRNCSIVNTSHRNEHFCSVLKTRQLHNYSWGQGLRAFGAERERMKTSMVRCIRRIWADDPGQDIAEYAVMLAVILVLVVGTIRLVGTNANNAFSAVASSIQ
jgi:Flp pilus assembly pilin Flp